MAYLWTRTSESLVSTPVHLASQFSRFPAAQNYRPFRQLSVGPHRRCLFGRDHLDGTVACSLYNTRMNLLSLLWIAGLVYSLPASQPQTVLSLSELGKIAPKVMIVSMFEPEEKAWTSRLEFTHEVEVVGLSLMYPNVRCVDDYSICQFTTGEGEINAAASMAFLLANPQFDLKSTYWLLAGIAGGEPTKVTTGTVTFAKYAIQVGLQYQIDSRELEATHPDWPTGYFSYGTKDPWTYPDSVYGTEVFELNENLRNRAISLAAANINNLNIGDHENIRLRKLYPYAPAAEPPTVVGCDVLTSDNYFTGEVLSRFFSNYTSMISNGTATYCSTAQEENATLEALIRLAKANLVDFNRIVVLRTISNFVRAPPSLAHSPIEFFSNYPKGGIQHSLDNLYFGGYPFVKDVVENWHVYNHDSCKPDNYVGNIFGSLGGKPDFGKDLYQIR